MPATKIYNILVCNKLIALQVHSGNFDVGQINKERARERESERGREEISLHSKDPNTCPKKELMECMTIVVIYTPPLTHPQNKCFEFKCFKSC